MALIGPFAKWRNLATILLLVAVLAAIWFANARQYTGGGKRYVLAISWQPAFCETRPGKPECKSQRQAGNRIDKFSLHGLWPQPRRNTYCGVGDAIRDRDKGGNWLALPAPALSPELAKRLARAMPGVASGLERHEWIKHGTCYGKSAREYFQHSLDLLDAINNSQLGVLFASAIGRALTGDTIRAGFEQTFGPGAGQHMRIACKQDGNRRLIVEITIGLAGDLSLTSDVGALIRAAPATDPGCPGGVVDPVGLQ